jgi:hypothetical protein
VLWCTVAVDGVGAVVYSSCWGVVGVLLRIIHSQIPLPTCTVIVSKN